MPLCACLPSPPPDSLLAEEAEVIGLRMEVVEPGPNSLDLLPIPADRIRSEALPGDRIRLTALVANEDGVLDLEPFEALWLITNGRRFPSGEADELELCEPSRPLLLGELCEIGRGASIEWVVHDLAPEQPLDRQFDGVLLVIGLDTPTDECFDRLANDRDNLSSDCLVATRSLNLGPLSRLVELMVEQGIPLDDEGEIPTELPAEAIPIAPNFAPETSWLTLSRPGELLRVWPGERTSLPEGALYEFALAVEPRDRQNYFQPLNDDIVLFREFVLHRWHATAVFFEDSQIRVPSDVDSFTVVVVTTDNRRSQTWSVFDFDVVPP